jgi:hypothetical protein
MPPDRPRARRVYGLLAVLLLAGLGALLWWSDRPAVRYAAMPCQYAALYAMDGPAAAVVLGSSRSQYGVDNATLAAGLGLDPATAPVANLSRGGRGPGQLYQQLVDLDASRGIDGPILFEVSPEDTAFWRRTPLYYQYYPGFARAVPLERVVADWSTKPHEPAYSRARDLLDDLLTRVDTALDVLVTGGWRRNANRATRAAGPVDCRTRLDDTTTPGERRQLIRAEKALERAHGEGASWRDQPPAPDELGRVNQDRQLAYLAEVRQFAAERGLPVVFHALPSYLGAPVAPTTRTRFADAVGAPLEVPPDALLDDLAERRLWRDAYHLNGAGAERLTGWLTEAARRAEAAAPAPDGSP